MFMSGPERVNKGGTAGLFGDLSFGNKGRVFFYSRGIQLAVELIDVRP